jgi:hypothetical protein
MTDSLGGDRTRHNGRKSRPSCPCGSGLPRRILEDARGIFCTYVCNECERHQRSKYRADIFTNPNYWTDEPIEEES